MESVGEFEYSTKDLIGHGAFAVVFKGRHKTNPGLTVAIKSITKKNLAKSQNLLGKEIKILKELTELHHENVVALLDCKETAHHVYLVMEYCNGGDLADYLHAKGTLSEDTIHLFLRQIAGAMRALNGKDIVHRDLKPQNILLCHSGKLHPPPSEITLKIADFGFARFLQDGVMAATLCGSPMYMAPEVIMSLQYDAKADLWSIGTIVFQCLTGKAPFQAQTPQALKQFYEKNSNLAPRIPNGTSPELTDLLIRLLKRNAKDRMDFDQFFSHPFLKPVTRLSSPVPVPSRLSLSPEYISLSPISPVDTTSTGYLPASPEGWCKKLVREDAYLPQDIKGLSKEKSTPSSPDEQDFVIVPSSLPEDPQCDATKRTYAKWHPGEASSPPSKMSVSSNPSQKSGIDLDISPVTGVTAPHPVKTSPDSSPRPTTLSVTATTDTVMAATALFSYPHTEPIPVPSQKEAYEQIQRSLQESESSLSAKSAGGKVNHSGTGSSPYSSSGPNIQYDVSEGPKDSVTSQNSDPNRSTAINVPCPPTVHFAIGTPPTVGRRWSISAGTSVPSTLSSSPLRRSGASPQTGYHHAGNSLAPIMGSPTQEPSKPDLYPCLKYLSETTETGLKGLESGRNINTMSCPIRMTFGSRTMTLPEIGSKGICLASHSPPGSAVIPYHQQFCWLANSQDPHNSPKRVRRSSTTCAFSDTSLTGTDFNSSPLNMDGAVMFVAPELPEETLLEKEHNETLAKLNFILALVECILDLAKQKSTPLAALTDSVLRKEHTLEQISVVSEGYRRAEQLVLYMRALQLLSSSLQLSRQEVHAGRLQPSSSVKNVLQSMKEHFHYCLNMCKSLNAASILHSNGVDPASSNITADRLIYNYAIEMCQSAALEELFGNPEECFKHYQTAQILLHSLAQQVNNDDDKKLLFKYKDAVEKRLYVLQSQGYIYSYDAT